MSLTFRAIVAGAVAAPLCLSCSVFGGDTNPPAGPVGGTMKTLQEVEPRTPLHPEDFPVQITASGSYYLTGNVNFLWNAGDHGIEILRDNVTIDLMGFTLDGYSEVIVSGAGILAAQGIENITIRNGVVRRWGGGGVSLGNTTANVLVEDMIVSQNGSSGITTYINSNVRRCVAEGNGFHGITVGSGSIVECSADSNGGDGLTATGGGVISNCSAQRNGTRGIRVAGGGSILNCGSSYNDSYGLMATDGCVIADSGSRFDAAGVFLDESTIARGVSVHEPVGDGFRVWNDSAMHDCLVKGAGGDGIEVTWSARIDRCHVTDCVGDGLVISNSFGSNAQITNSRFADNAGNGVYLRDDSTVSGCTFWSNGGAGVLVEVNGDDNRVQGNEFVQNATGVDVNGTGNLIIQNTASGNGLNFSIVAGNSVGDILNVAGATITTTNPWRNLAY